MIRLAIVSAISITATIAGARMVYSLIATEPNSAKAFLLPGETTHGHYQIEMKCSACHDAGMGVNNDSCRDCHAALAEYDTHPAKKFRDPTNVHRLEKIEARECITCHREHVPRETHAMGLTMPVDYCQYCHQEIGESRPSHVDLAFNTCLNTGCHNYHDNSALYEDFLFKHYEDSDLNDDPRVLLREAAEGDRPAPDAPRSMTASDETLSQWRDSAHAVAAVNCRNCHETTSDDQTTQWSDAVGTESCAMCHKRQVESFGLGKHGMRPGIGLSPMTPGDARLPMKADAAHRSLNCMSCHNDHKFDTQYAAVDACLQCHDDQHSLSYKGSAHFSLWQAEVDGSGEVGTGVSCATCHLPREKHGKTVVVNHNQNSNLEPIEGMLRSVCLNCHGLQYSIDSLIHEELTGDCFTSRPETSAESIRMAYEWLMSKKRKRTSD